METEKLKELLMQIEMPDPAVEKILEASRSIVHPNQESAGLLARKSEWNAELARLKESLGEDEDGFKMLTYMLLTSLFVKETYQKSGIPSACFYDTMACFSRFVREHKESFGSYGFDREWWTTRQLSCLLFRLGALEFEMSEFQGSPSVCIHIPSDADLTAENCRDSYRQAISFFQLFFPGYNYSCFSCSSWLLAPPLSRVLKEDSRILEFQKQFQIIREYPDNQEFLTWIFKKEDCKLQELPEKTSLQRNVKAYLLQGGKIGSADGILKDSYIK